MAKVLNVWDSQRFLQDVIPFAPAIVTRDPEKGLQFARQHYPVVLKAISDEIVHKSDSGAVVLNVDSDDRFLDEFYRMLDRFHSPVMVQKQVSGVEVFLGAKRDPQFGPVVLFGLGGIFVEVYRDVVARAAPIAPEDFDEMVLDLKGRKILQGARGKRVDLEALRDIVVRFSRFVATAEGWEEIDVNPLMALPDGALAVDARVVTRDSRA